MDILLLAVVPFAGSAVLLITAFMTLPANARMAMASRIVAGRDSRELRALEAGMLSLRDSAIAVPNRNLHNAA